MSGSRVSRILCLLLSLLLAFTAFSVNVSAADDTNLIESDLRDWQSIEANTTTSSVIKYNDSFLLASSAENLDNGTYYKSTILYDLSQLIAGNSYTFSFEVLDLIEAQSFNAGLNWDNYYGGPASRSGSYIFGLASYDYASNTVNIVDNFSIEINSSNYSSMYGNTHTLTFDMPDVVNPCFIIHYGELSYNYQNQYIMLRDLSLVDNTKASTDSFLERILNGISGFFSGLSSDISAGLSNVRDGITTKFGEFQGWLSSLGDRISGFFSGLSKDISDGLTNVRDGITTKFGEFQGWLTSLGDRISDFFVELGDKLLGFFDKFKPRVNINLQWIRGTVNGSTGEIILPTASVPLIIVSDFFVVPEGSTYLVDYVRGSTSHSSAQHASIFQYDLSGNFIGTFYSSPSNFSELELPSGYQYIFRQSWKPTIDVDNSLANESFSVYADEGWINALLFNFKTMIQGLFVPDEQFITQWKNNMELTLSEHLGFIYQIPALTVDYVERLQSLLSNKDVYFSIPSCEFELNGELIHLWDELSVDLSFLTQAKEGSIWHTLYVKIYPVFLRLTFYGILFLYGKHEWERVMMN